MYIKLYLLLTTRTNLALHAASHAVVWLKQSSSPSSEPSVTNRT